MYLNGGIFLNLQLHYMFCVTNVFILFYTPDDGEIVMTPKHVV